MPVESEEDTRPGLRTRRRNKDVHPGLPDLDEGTVPARRRTTTEVDAEKLEKTERLRVAREIQEKAAKELAELEFQMAWEDQWGRC